MLGIVRVDGHSLALGIGVDGIAGDALYLCHDDGPGQVREDDLTVFVRPVQPVAGLLAALGIKTIPPHRVLSAMVLLISLAGASAPAFAAA